MTPTINGWTYADAAHVLETGLLPNGNPATQAQESAANLAIYGSGGFEATGNVPGANQGYNWPATPPAAPPPHQAAGSAAAIAASGISPMTIMGGLQESQAYKSYLQRYDDINWGNTNNQTGWGEYAPAYAEAEELFNTEGGADSYPSLPPNPVYQIGADFATYHSYWVRPLPPPASPDNPGGQEPPPTLVTAATVSTFDYSAATAKKHAALSAPPPPIAVVIPTEPTQTTTSSAQLVAEVLKQLMAAGWTPPAKSTS